jgi:hypothetical protein
VNGDELKAMAENGQLKERLDTMTEYDLTAAGHHGSNEPNVVRTPEGEVIELDELPLAGDIKIRQLGVIYLTQTGDATPSGRHYVGSADNLEERDANSVDGRRRSDADILDYYLQGDLIDRYSKERQKIAELGGLENLDNRILPPDPNNLSFERPYKPK